MKNILVVSGGNAKYSEKRQDLIKGGYEYFQSSNKKHIDDDIYDNDHDDVYRNDIFRCPCCNRELGRENSENLG